MSTPSPQADISAPNPPKERNTLGIVALAISIIGFIFACIPGFLIIGWLLLPIGFILGIVAAVLKGKAKWPGIAAIIISVVGTIVGILVFLFVVGNAVDQALNEDVTSTVPGASQSGTETSTAAPADNAASTSSAPDSSTSNSDGKQGTRENPLPLGTELSSKDWKVTINSVDLNATEAITSFNTFNQPADPGQTYILVNATFTYIGNDPNGAIPFTLIEYVTPQGNTHSSVEKPLVAPDAIDMSTLYSGASVTGNIPLAVPSEGLEQGVLAVQPDILADKAFIAVK
ncbi:MAG: hypothetical protein Q4C87_07900 [Actinomycetaceae bacterium]|nr:hypothetical protein [Actinomycetaceae bacterium]